MGILARTKRAATAGAATTGARIERVTRKALSFTKPVSLLDLSDEQVSVLVEEVVEGWTTQFSDIAYDPDADEH